MPWCGILSHDSDKRLFRRLNVRVLCLACIDIDLPCAVEARSRHFVLPETLARVPVALPSLLNRSTEFDATLNEERLRNNVARLAFTRERRCMMIVSTSNLHRRGARGAHYNFKPRTDTLFEPIPWLTLASLIVVRCLSRCCRRHFNPDERHSNCALRFMRAEDCCCCFGVHVCV